ncbi:alkylation response protein AidB-like acyl-CoA dehydrogenase [Amycolatopsis lexingtonensis]|uniref:Alkylation response protein AidB-like acyl-CoA dehydrogenase n=1 Tax=Amycolatopsis lexingtonensis TaxID=218822 RepID=A0ABR9HT39_9PSEU|nr:acyl-CoA dehydrogenase family protein [Amycolatopsis lexingtonensis]MBE1494103.1 alkylation response protein AidB-like acyl-CoA dehydrogenase [Amycolatopsis lexingtonensis]
MTSELLEPTQTAAERDAIVGLVREFVQERVAPRVAEYDAAEELPADLLHEMAQLGFFGGVVPVEWGGLGLDHVTFTRIIEEVSRVDHCLGVLMSMPSALVGSGLLEFGTTEQKQQWLVPLAEGKLFGGAGVTEPRSGSDVAGTQTRYTREGGGYVLNGAKAWITNLDRASFFVTFATRDPALGRRGLSAFIVPADTPGVLKNPVHNKLGFRPLCSGDLVFDNVRLGPDAMLGAEGDGFAVAMNAVERGRLSVASRAVGLAQSCLDASVRYARDRVVFGQPITDFQMVQQKIANMAVSVQAARLLTERCAEAMQRGERARVEASMAKMYASDVAQAVATDAVQIHGAYGVSEEYPVARAYRDAKVFQIVEGANDIHRVLIAKDAIRGESRR